VYEYPGLQVQLRPEMPPPAPVEAGRSVQLAGMSPGVQALTLQALMSAKQQQERQPESLSGVQGFQLLAEQQTCYLWWYI